MSIYDEFCSTNEEFCIKNEELCIKNDEFAANRLWEKLKSGTTTVSDDDILAVFTLRILVVSKRLKPLEARRGVGLRVAEASVHRPCSPQLDFQSDL